MPEPPSNPAIHRISSSSGLVPESSTDSSTTIRPRNRRPPNSTSAPLLSSPSASSSRGASPIPSARIGSVTGRNNARAGSPAAFGGGGGGRGLLGEGVSSWAGPTWSSLQGLASSLLGGTVGGADGAGDDGTNGRGKSRMGSRKSSGLGARRTASGVGNGSAGSGAWGPEPPSTRPRLNDVAAGSLAEREAALKAMKTASVLQSHEGVNGGLDVSGRFKKRMSDEDLRGSSAAQNEETEEHLVYIHQVQPSDTYAGIVLRYRCREDAFRKANGLWSRDNTYIHLRKWLALPVDACEIRGRPCEPPNYFNSQKVDLLAPTPDAAEAQDDPFSTGTTPQHHYHQPKPPSDEDRPWTHVRWVTIDSFATPVEIARVPRKALGYFPPRRKKSLQTTTASTLSTPRGSTDVPPLSLADDVGGAHSPSSTATRSRRLSVLSGGSSFDTAAAHRPAWMRRPGGVGSLHGRVRGPDGDYLNAWTRKHLPALNIEGLPSMSVMGSESARFGFDDAVPGTGVGASDDGPSGGAGIVESPFEDGRDLESVSRGGGGGVGGRNASGNGLDKAAAAVEMWLRGALAKIPPGTPVLGPRGGRHAGHGGGGRQDYGQGVQGEGDLIELADTNSDDGPGGGGPGDLLDSGLLGSGVFGSSGRSDGGGAGLRGRSAGAGAGKGKANKAD